MCGICSQHIWSTKDENDLITNCEALYVQFQVDNVEIELAIIKYTNIATQTQIPGQLQNTSIWGRSIIEHTHFVRMEEPRETPKGESL